MNPHRLAQTRSFHPGLLCLATSFITLFLALPAWPLGADSVIVVGGRYPAGQAGLSAPIRLVNSERLSEVSVPLELRAITPGAFVLALDMSYDQRLFDPFILPDSIRTYHFESQDAAPPCRYANPTYTDGRMHAVTSSPEAVWFYRSGDAAGEFLQPGADLFVGPGCMNIGFALTSTPGTFEIDTTCLDPGLPRFHLRFFSPDVGLVPVFFQKGIVTINGAPLARDTAIEVLAGGIVTGMLPASDPNPADTLLFSLGVSSTENVNINPSGTFTYFAPGAPGTDFFEFVVNDGLAQDVGMVNITILAPPPDTLYVRTTGSNSTGDGSSGNPFRTIPHAISVSNDGDVILVGPGTYSNAGEVPIVFPLARSLSVLSEQGPFATHLVGSPSASGSVVVMNAGNAFDTLTIEGFTIRDNSVTDLGCDFCGGGITVVNPTVARILNCIIRDNTASGVAGESAGGILFTGSGGLVANNWITSNSGVNDPSAVGGVIVWSSANVSIVNNTISHNSGPGESGTAGIQLDDGSSISRLDNNIVSFNSPGHGLLASSPLLGTESTFNNLYFGNGLSPMGFPSTSGWVFSDPLLAAPGDDDYHLTCFSTARNAGRVASVPAGLSRDIDGQLRTTSGLQVDIGADQFYDADKQAIFTPSVDSGCVPLTVAFTNQSLCIDELWRWNFGNGQTSTLKNPTIQFANPGTYSVRLIALGDLDADTAFRTIKVDAPLTANFTSDVQSGCVPFQVTFTAFANSDVDLYTWDFGDGQIANGQQVTHTYTTAGTRTVLVHATNTCGTTTHTKPNYIAAKMLPVVQLLSSFDSVSGAPCNPYPVQFRYTSDRPILAWQWDFGDNHTSTDSMPFHVYAEGDTFSVRLIATGECGDVQVVRSSYIRLTPRPIVTASATPVVACKDLSQVVFSGTITGSYTSAFWAFGDGTTAPGLNTTHVYSQVGRYLPKLVVISACGQDSIPIADSITVGSVPGAAFSVDADSGYEPLSVRFTDETSNLPTSWLWRFGDNQTSTQQNPTHAYASGVHAASLIAGSQCGSDTSADIRVVVGSFRAVIVDSIGTSGDTILYSIRVDSLVIPYDHTVHLSGRITPLPLQGFMDFTFAPASGVPPFVSIMKAVPSFNLSSGNYSLELRAVDSTRLNQQGQAVTKTTTRAYVHVGFSSLQVTPSPIVMDSTIANSFLTTRTVTIRNTSTLQQPFTLVVQAAQISGPPFEILPNQGNGATLTSGEELIWNFGFRPTRKGDFTGWLRVHSNDPANSDLEVLIFGRGIGEQVPPIVAAASPSPNAEATIDQSVALTFSEPLVVVTLDTVFEVRSKRANASIPGVAQMTPLTLTFAPTNWFWPDDTVTVTLRGIVTDTNGNGLDGDGDGVESGSPTDDYRLTFFTGPGVFPGDANHDGVVNEVDILPLGRFWRLQGPPRSRPYTSFTIQPSRGFPTRVAAHADCDGNGIIDSADICPIVEFFDRDTVLSKAVVQTRLAETESWSASVVDALLGALAGCPAQGQGNEILRQILIEAQSQNPVPADYALDQNYPNPFNPATVIAFSLTQSGEIALDIFDILGRRVTTIAEGHWETGTHRVIWDGRDEEGREMASGIYFYRLHTDHFTQTRKMLLLK